MPDLEAAEGERLSGLAAGDRVNQPATGTVPGLESRAPVWVFTSVVVDRVPPLGGQSLRPIVLCHVNREVRRVGLGDREDLAVARCRARPGCRPLPEAAAGTIAVKAAAATRSRNESLHLRSPSLRTVLLA